MDELPITLIEFDIGGGNVVRVELQEYRGKPKVCVRSWYLDAKGERKAGRTGINLDIDHVRVLARGVVRAKRKAIELNLIADPQADAE